MPELLSTRALNRATLARQWLLERQGATALQAIEHLIGLQAQAPTPPYFGLWCRLADFTAADLSGLLLGRQAVRLVLMRGTVHLVSARDALTLRPLVQPLMDRDLRSNTTYAPPLAGLDLTELAARGREVLDRRALTLPELRPLLAERSPDRDPAALTYALRNLLALVQVPPRGVWGQSGPPRLMTAQGWLGQELKAAPSPDELVLRYLRAFGPASVGDVQTWCGLTRLRAVLERLRPQLVTFRDDRGVELFDLPEAPRPSEETPAPVRLLAAFDNLLLSYADRRRVMDADAHRRVFDVKNGIFPHTLLVDGSVAGTWRIEIKRQVARLTMQPFQAPSKALRFELEAEGERLLRVAAPQSARQELLFP